MHWKFLQDWQHEINPEMDEPYTGGLFIKQPNGWLIMYNDDDTVTMWHEMPEIKHGD